VSSRGPDGTTGYYVPQLLAAPMREGVTAWQELQRMDEVLIVREEEALRRRRPKSRPHGRPGTPAAVALRMLVLKHLYD